jgi:hypothetical protein
MRRAQSGSALPTPQWTLSSCSPLAGRATACTPSANAKETPARVGARHRASRPAPPQSHQASQPQSRRPCWTGDTFQWLRAALRRSSMIKNNTWSNRMGIYCKKVLPVVLLLFGITSYNTT